MAVQLAAAEATRKATEESLAVVRRESAARDAQRVEEVSGLQRTIEDLRAASNRIESEQRRLLVVADDYKTAAGRDREALLAERENVRAREQAIQSMQGAMSRLNTERGVFEGRAVAAENHAQRLQEDRDRAMAEATEATQRATRAEARADRFEGALQAIKAKNKSQHPQPEEPENAAD
jgi:chromosome segregation ATPase